jgi:hypothetical protein
MKNNGLMKKNVLKLNTDKNAGKKNHNQSYHDLTLDLSKDNEIIKNSPGGLFDKSIVNGIETMDSIFKMKEKELLNNSNRLQFDSNKTNTSIGSVRMNGILNTTNREDITVDNEINYPVSNELNEAVIIEKSKCCWKKILFILLIIIIAFVIFIFGGFLTYVLILKNQQKNTNKNNNHNNHNNSSINLNQGK